VQVTFRSSDCTPCPDRARCTRAPTNPRHLTFRPRPQYETQCRIRAEQATPAWQQRYAHRSGIEGTIAQACRRSDLHHARYRGLPKVHLQHVLTALALNLVRLDAWLTGNPLGGSWVSRLTRLRPGDATGVNSPQSPGSGNRGDLTECRRSSSANGSGLGSPRFRSTASALAATRMLAAGVLVRTVPAGSGTRTHRPR
jgi:Transposase DDE domain